MRATTKFVRLMLVITGIVLFLFLIMQPLTILKFRDQIAILFPKGLIALKELNLLLVIQGLMLLVVLPVYILTFIFSWKYRASNPQGKYDPDLVDNLVAEFFWWGIPFVMTLLIAILTWVKTYELDPFRGLSSEKKPITIQAVATQWNWLFIYPEEKIASLNFLQIPTQTPIHFEITADAPMNSLWIPDLGGQIYAMPKMRTELNLVASEEGDFRGSSANLSGEGFAGMNFITRAGSQEDYQKWVQSASQGRVLDRKSYDKLAEPSENTPPEVFRLGDEHLFHQILMKYMHPEKEPS